MSSRRSVPKHARRKLTPERVLRINRSRDLREGHERSIELPRQRVRLDESGRGVELYEGAKVDR